MDSEEPRIEQMEEVGMPFLGFPDEIIEKIFFDLDFADRCKMRGMNKRLCGIEDRMKKPLENRGKLEISGVDNTSSELNITIVKHNEKVSLDEAILLIHRFAKIFKFKIVVFSPSQKEHLILLDDLKEVATDLFRISAWNYNSNHLSHLFDRATVGKVVEMADIVKIMRICAPVKTEDLLHFKEIAQASANFCGIALRISRKTARDFVKSILGEEDKMVGGFWRVEKIEGKLEMVVKRFWSGYIFGLYNSECEEKYPRLRSHDLYGLTEYESEEDSDDDDDDEDSYCYDSDYDYGDWYEDQHERLNYHGSDDDWSPYY